jgi:hypothetical protein
VPDAVKTPCLDICEQLLAQAIEPSLTDEGPPWPLVILLSILIIVFVEDVSFEIADCTARSVAYATCPTSLLDNDHSLTPLTAAISLVLLAKRLRREDLVAKLARKLHLGPIDDVADLARVVR